MERITRRIVWILGRYLSPFHIKRAVYFILIDLIALSFVRRGKSGGTLLAKFDVLGDYIINRKLLAAVRTVEKGRLCLVANLQLKDFIDLYDKAYYDEVIYVHRRRLLDEFIYRYQVLAAVKRRGFDRVISLVRDPYLEDAFVWSTRAPKRYGRKDPHDTFEISLAYYQYHLRVGDIFYTDLLCRGIHEEVPFEFETNQALLREIYPGITLPVDTRFKAIPQPGVSFKNYVILLPGSTQQLRCWRLENFGAVSRFLLERGYTVIFAGTAPEGIAVEAMLQTMPHPNAHNLCGKLTLPQLVALIDSAVYGLTNDSGGLHIFAALDRPALAVSNGLSYLWFHPYPQYMKPSVSHLYPTQFDRKVYSLRNNVPFLGKKILDVNLITVDQVLERIKTDLALS